MELAQFKDKVDSMLPDLMKAIQAEALRLFASGAIDTAEFGDDFALPKICLTVAIENQAHQYRPPSSRYKAVAKNLRQF